jgi:hypothetical protein
MVDQFAADKTRDQSEHNPREKRHDRTLLPVGYEHTQSR